jgi:phosphoribosylformylglycinamidine synthase subunit PurQ / glutaminase
MNFAILQFPASNCDQDAVHAVELLGHSARYVWHKRNSLGDAEAVIVPGGFSYGDYLRCGAIARFSPVMQAVKQFADNGGLVLGICNGFQVLTEAGLLPGALVRNRDLQFHCEHIYLNTVTADSPFTNRIPPDKLLRIPIAHGEGCYFADEPTLGRLRANPRFSGGTSTTGVKPPRGRTRTVRWTTSPASATTAATWPVSCRTPNAPANRCWAAPTAV